GWWAPPGVGGHRERPEQVGGSTGCSPGRGRRRGLLTALLARHEPLVTHRRGAGNGRRGYPPGRPDSPSRFTRWIWSYPRGEAGGGAPSPEPQTGGEHGGR